MTLKKLCYLNMLYAVCRFVMIFGSFALDGLPALMMYIVLIAFNWIVLQKLKGHNIVSDKLYNLLAISCLLIGFLLLADCIYGLKELLKTIGNVPALLILTLIKMLFSGTIILHVIRSYKLEFEN